MDNEDQLKPINNEDISFSIDQIKGIDVTPQEVKKKSVKRNVMLKEKLTPDHLIRDSGIPELIKRGRKLNLDKSKNVITQSDKIMQMYRDWSGSVYGLIPFEDFLSRVDDMSGNSAIGSLLDSYADAERIKYQKVFSSLPKPQTQNSSIEILSTPDESTFAEKEVSLDKIMPAFRRHPFEGSLTRLSDDEDNV